MGRSAVIALILAYAAMVTLMSSCDGVADPASKGNFLGDSVIDDGGGGGRSDIDPGQLYTVTKIVEASSDITTWTNSDLPFNTTRRQLGTIATDSQWPFEFTYTFPTNNYSLTDAHLMLVTSRDSSDTEAIFVDGVFTGRPPGNNVSSSSPYVTDRMYSCVGACTAGTNPPAGTVPNTFYLDWALSHYKVNTQNTFDLQIENLLTGTSHTTTSLLQDGNFKVVSGDDAFVQTDTATASRPLLFLTGSTYSVSALTCTTSPTYKLLNTYIHNDGNSIGSSAFSGSVLTPFQSTSSTYTTFRSVEFYFDPRLPTLASYDLLNITKAEITLQLRRASTSATAIVVNGIGIDQDGFDRTSATTEVESWSEDTAVRSAYNTLINAIPATNTVQAVTINLITLLGADTVKQLLLQGKLNIALAGPIARVTAANNTSARTYGVQVTGPELILEGNYAAEICEVPDNPSSPLNGGSSGPAICSGAGADTAFPTFTSIQAINVTSNSATIQWLTNEPSSTQVGYGLLNPGSLTTLVPALTTFHSVTITGLQPYKYYQYNVRSTDECGNSGISATKTFRTLR
ncbi:MAG: hypothetical protein K0R29_1198 [Pseudobdellovibrio sp.]|nr:hypothetical protein [Pseudobdellovibrio sp.]